MAIDATVGGVDANSYGTLAEARDYFKGRLNSSSFDDADSSIQEQALRTAVTYLDSRVKWIGDIKDQTTPQALAWPRVYDATAETPEDILVLGEAIPGDLKKAQFEMALYLLDVGEPEFTNELDSIKVGSLSIDFNEFKDSQLIPDTIWPMISYLGSRFTPGAQLKSVSTYR
ncbi:MAG: hypothetical protein QNJ81_02230 [Acidimicrobiia bacterium]|nr:hypothetical protein [Acidimicrobiia bacterium]